jgi:hypothetical protein
VQIQQPSVGSKSHLAESSSHLANKAVMKQKSSRQCMYLKTKIHQTSFNCALQNFKNDVDKAIEKTHSHAYRIHWVI